MRYRYDCSYPFRDVALRHRADYGDVLAYAVLCGIADYDGVADVDQIDSHNYALAHVVPRAARQEIADLCLMEVAERGGRVEMCDSCSAEYLTNGPLPLCLGGYGRSECLVYDLMASPRVHQC